MKTKFKKNQKWKFPMKIFKKINHSLIYQPFRKKYDEIEMEMKREEKWHQEIVLE